MANTKQTPIRLGDTIKERLQKIVAWEGTDQAEVVRRLINQEYFTHQEEIEEFLKNNPDDYRKTE